MAVNVGTVIGKAWSKFQDNSTALRSKMVVWFNEVARDIQSQPRQWWFLKTVSSALPITANQFTMPTGWREILSITIGDTRLTPEDQMTDDEAANWDSATGTVSSGYTVSPAGVVTLIAGATGTAVVVYTAGIAPDYADSANTAFPIEFEGLFVAGLRMHYYDYWKDARYGKENSLYQQEMYRMKAWDNRMLLAEHGIHREGKNQGAR